ncbi:hypothetical protein ACFYO2_44165 [Streptomyces sp. NPDC006602]|uniref:hypothetical protein n=1 Tax=Streptomyces sp. NPDC006602 TaxID=3364751 RepID=UPI003691425D
MISAGGATLPVDSSDIHYAARNGTAQVSFRSGQVPDYLHRAGLDPVGRPCSTRTLPQGLCGPGLRGRHGRAPGAARRARE